MELPPEYLDYPRSGGTATAFLTRDFPSYMQLWPLDKINEYNLSYGVTECAPGFVCFGSNGGGELLAFDQGGAVYCLPAIGIEPKSAVRVADSWSEFARYVDPATKS